MRTSLSAAVLALSVLAPGIAVAAIPCSDLPKAQHFVEKLHRGPNTRAAQRHLEAAEHAKSERRCSAELTKVEHYARRSDAADKRLAREGH